jgi:hypothetical protein
MYQSGSMQLHRRRNHNDRRHSGYSQMRTPFAQLDCDSLVHHSPSEFRLQIVWRLIRRLCATSESIPAVAP